MGPIHDVNKLKERKKERKNMGCESIPKMCQNET